MDEFSLTMTAGTGTSTASYRWAALAGLGAILYLLPLGWSWPLLDPDEGLHAAIAQEMVEKGDWLVPRLFGRAFWDKPAFYFWFEAASLRAWGMNERAVRLPGLLFALCGAVSTAALAARSLGRTIAPAAAAFYATMFLPMALSLAATHDVALVVWTNLALLMFWESLWAARGLRRWTWVGGAGLALGLAMLTKGLFGVALVLTAHVLYLIVSRRLAFSHVTEAVVAVSIGAALAALWFWPMHRQNPGYLQYFFIERHFLGLFGATQTHGEQPFWYYAPVLLLGGLPWIGYLPPLVRDALDRRRTSQPALDPLHRDAIVWLLCQLIGCTLLLSLAGSKLATYLWPVFPSVAILAAYAWRRWLNGGLSPAAAVMMRQTLLTSCVCGPIVFLPVAFVAAEKLDLRLPAPVWWVVAAAALSPLVVLAVWRRWGLRNAMGTAVATTALQFAMAILFVLPPAAEQLSARRLAHFFNEQTALPENVRIVDERVGSLVFYLRPELRTDLRPGRIARISARLACCEPRPLTLVVPENRLARLRRHCDLHHWPFVTVERHRIYCLPRFEELPASLSWTPGPAGSADSMGP